jgi:hypothetical protein
MVMSGHQNAQQGYNLLIANKPFENVAKFMRFITTVTTQICTHEDHVEFQCLLPFWFPVTCLET